MKRLFLVIGAFALVVSACGGGSAGSCADIVDDGMVVMQDIIDEFDNMSADDIQAFSSGEEPAFIAGMESKLDELDQRANDANCSTDELEQLFQEKAPSLTAKTDLGQLMIDGLAQGGVFD